MKVFAKLWNIISTLIVILIVILAILLGGVRLVGLRPFAVLSGSMEPTYHVGSLIYVKSCDPEDVEVGDPITFVLDEDLNVATHRVISIDPERSKKIADIAAASDATLPAYLEREKGTCKVTVIHEPAPEEIPIDVAMTKVIEFYAR